MSKQKVSNKELRILFSKAESQGWSVEFTKKCHFKMTAPNGGIVFCASTPSEYRGMKNLLSQMKKHGFKETR